MTKTYGKDNLVIKTKADGSTCILQQDKCKVLEHKGKMETPKDDTWQHMATK